ncbi:hypothetical protein LWI29_003616, partial [Acer saccharum]
VLRKVGDLAAFRRTCFGHLIDIPKDLTFSAGVLHNLLRQVHVPDVTGQNEFHFSVGGKLLKFTQREFCLVTGLQIGVMSDIFLKPYAPIEGGIHERYFDNDENLHLIWAMEALGSLIELVGENLGHSHPRLRNWRIFKRPHDFFKKFAKYEQAVQDGQHVILEELPTVNEREQPYLEGIDTDLSDGPQFVPDNLEEDDGREGVDFEVGNDDNDGGQSRPQQKKRKRSPRKQKITPNTKRQRTSGDTSPVGDESTVSSQTRQLMKEMSDRFEDIVKKEISAMERRIKRRLTRVEKSVDQLVDARREVTNLFSFLTGM